MVTPCCTVAHWHQQTLSIRTYVRICARWMTLKAERQPCSNGLKEKSKEHNLRFGWLLTLAGSRQTLVASFNPLHCLENPRWKSTGLFPIQHSLLSHSADITGGFQGSSSKLRGLNCSTLLCLLLSLHMSVFCITSIQSTCQELNKLSNNETTKQDFFLGSDKALLLKPDEEFLPLKSRF